MSFDEDVTVATNGAETKQENAQRDPHSTSERDSPKPDGCSNELPRINPLAEFEPLDPSRDPPHEGRGQRLRKTSPYLFLVLNSNVSQEIKFTFKFSKKSNQCNSSFCTCLISPRKQSSVILQCPRVQRKDTSNFFKK